MPTYRITDPTTGKTLRLTGDSPPSEQELNEVFSQVGGKAGVAQTPEVGGFLQSQSEGESRVEEKIGGRTDSVARLKEEMAMPFKGSILQKGIKGGVTALKASAIPFQRIESGVAGLGLGLQKGEPLTGLKQAKSGLFGERQQELGDIIRTTGFGGGANEAIASGVGFTAALVTPIKAVKDASKALRGIRKFSDKGLTKAASKLIQGADDAVSKVGARLTRVYQPINKVKVNPSKVLDDVVDLPPSVISNIEKEIAQNLDDFLQDFTIEKARLLKRKLGELKPSAFGKAEKGAIDLVTDKQINRAYATIKKTMQESLDSAGLKKEAQALLKADDAFSETLNASRFIKKTITDPTLRKPTRTGRVALKLAKEGDLTARQALNTLKSSGGSIRNSINGAVIELERYNRLINITKFAESAGRAAVFGGVVGGTAGRVLEGGQ